MMTDVFLPHPSSPARVFSTSPVLFFTLKEGARDREVFLPHPSSPARRGSTSLLNPPILRRENLTGKPAVLYSQTSFNFVDFRLRSAEHSSELDALLSLARKFAPKGVAREYLTQQNCDCFTQQSRDCFTHDVRLFVRRGRRGASF